MVPYTTLRNVHLRLQQFKTNDNFFGGVNILLFGDLMQLPPVSKSAGGAYCFKQPQMLESEVQVMLRKNLNVGHGLVNGATGVVKKIELPALRCDQLEPGELPQAVFLQGTTLDKAVVDFGSKIFAKGQAYVALSRVRQLEGLAIRFLGPRKLIKDPYDKKSLEELVCLRNLHNS
ncbi:ATP-dependent DNA helicase PIF1-like [Cydia strobilella]|uniref:ATP-dependent DNA helicase PIF1-like n=1 Tax=Cydia strobilella TaxID=1100964 RepID=UPI003006EDD9